MEYTKEAIARRKYIMDMVKKITFKILYILLIISVYNAILITKSTLSEHMSKEIFGYKAYIITTTSMEPTIKKGDVIVVEKCEEEKLKQGDIITLKSNGEFITHRIAEIRK